MRGCIRCAELYCGVGIGCFLISYDTLLAFEITDALPDQMEDLSGACTAFVLGDLVQLIVKLRFNLYSKMLIFLVSHITPQKINLI